MSQKHHPLPKILLSMIGEVEVTKSGERVKLRSLNLEETSSRSAYNSMFVRLRTDYEIRNGGYFESIKNSANQFISKP